MLITQWRQEVGRTVPSYRVQMTLARGTRAGIGAAAGGKVDRWALCVRRWRSWRLLGMVTFGRRVALGILLSAGGARRRSCVGVDAPGRVELLCFNAQQPVPVGGLAGAVDPGYCGTGGNVTAATRISVRVVRFRAVGAVADVVGGFQWHRGVRMVRVDSSGTTGFAGRVETFRQGGPVRSRVGNSVPVKAQRSS